ncbi:MAG: hypothetical protein FJ191_10620 [Gammaproteobacteria bacterium]|nr:hypothetical protein [Gammaproteobacteria bacterium]
MAAAPLTALARIARHYGRGLAARKLALLDALARARLTSADQVFRLHELLSFLAAYPDDRRIRARARRLLSRFGARADLRRHRARLAGSGIAGTDTPYRYFWPTAAWLARHWPGRLHLDRSDAEAADRLAAALPLLLPPAQADWLRESGTTPWAAIDALRAPGVTDAGFVLGLIARMPGDDRTREHFGDGLDLSYTLDAGADTPERSTAGFDTGAVVYQRRALDNSRPDLRAELGRPPRAIRELRATPARRLIGLARTCMVTRERDLAAFQFASPRDVFLVDDGDGLAFGLTGVEPARRTLLYSTWGALMLRNGVPLGYVQLDILGRHAALSFNTFATFRGAGSARLFGRLLATVRHVFGCDEFSIEPYQLGVGNEEGIESGAWWFYYRLGFRPRATEARRLVARELGRIAVDRRYRSAPRTLRALARWHLFFAVDSQRRPRLPRTAHWLGRAAGSMRRFPSADPEQRAAAAVAEALQRLQRPRGDRRLSPAERRVLQQWAPLVLSIPGLPRWPAADRRALWSLILAKAARSERDFQRRLLRHRRLRALLGF